MADEEVAAVAAVDPEPITYVTADISPMPKFLNPLRNALDLAWQVIDAVGGLAEMKAGYVYTKAVEARKATLGS